MRHSLGSYTGLGLQKLLRPSCNALVWGPKLRQRGVNPRALGPPATHSHLAAEAPLGMTKFGHQMLLILPVSHASAIALPAMVGDVPTRSLATESPTRRKSQAMEFQVHPPAVCAKSPRSRAIPSKDLCILFSNTDSYGTEKKGSSLHAQGHTATPKA